MAALDVDNGSVFFLVAPCSFRLTTGPRCSASWLVWTRRTVFHQHSTVIVDSCSGICRAGFAGIAPRAVFLPVVAWSQMLGIMAGTHQKDSYALFFFGSGMCKARFAGILHLTLCSSRGFQAQMPCRQARR